MQIEVEVLQPITVGWQNVDDVDRFTYLGRILACDGDTEADVNCKIGKAASILLQWLQCRRMRSTWTTSVISTDTFIYLFKINHITDNR